MAEDEQGRRERDVDKGKATSGLASFSLGMQAEAGALDTEEREINLRQQLVDWHRKVRDLRLSEMKKEHQVEILSARIEFLSGSVAQGESAIARLQAQLVERDEQNSKKESEWRERAQRLEKLLHRRKLAQSLRSIGDRTQIAKARTRAEKADRADKAKVPAKDKVAKASKDSKDDDVGLPYEDWENEAAAARLEADEEDELAQLGDADMTGLEMDMDASLSKGRSAGQPLEHLSQSYSVAPQIRNKWEEVVDHLRQELEASRVKLQSQKQQVDDLTRQLDHNRIALQSEKGQHAGKMERLLAERNRNLETAKTFINDLQDQVRKKDDVIQGCKQDLEKMKRKYEAQRQADDLEIDRLNDAMVQHGDRAMTELKSALTFLDDMPRMPKGVVSVAQMDEAIREREATITTLTQEVTALQKQLEDEKAMSAARLQQREAELTQANAHLDVARTSKPEEARLKQLVQKLMLDLDDRDAKVVALEGAVMELKQEALKAADLSVGQRPSQDEKRAEVDKELADHKAKLEKRVDQLHRQLKRCFICVLAVAFTTAVAFVVPAKTPERRLNRTLG